MKELKYVITDPMGIHARPAGLLVKEVAKYKCDIKLTSGTRTVNAKGIMGIMSLGIKKDQEVTFAFDGEDEETAYEAVKGFMQENL